MAFREQGIGSILISHKLNEVAKVADHITVLRDGRTVESIDCRAREISEDRIIRSMVGRDLADRFPPREREDRRDAVRVEELAGLTPHHRRARK